MISNKPIKKLKRCYSCVATHDRKYYIGTSSATIYIYDYQTTELLKKFQDIPYGDKLYLSDDNSLLIVKGTAGKIGVYDINSLTLKFVIKMNGTSQPQDANLCFSHCGNYLYNIVYDNDLLSYLIKIDLRDGSYEKLYNRPREVYNQILFVNQHNLYYLFGFERGKENRYFVRIFNIDFVKINEIGIEDYASQVEFSPKEDLFYIHFLSDCSVKAVTKDFARIVKEITSETTTKIIKGNNYQREFITSIYSYMSSLSLGKESLYLSIAYGEAVVLFDNMGMQQRIFPILCGSARFLNNDDEIIIKGEIYKILM